MAEAGADGRLDSEVRTSRNDAAAPSPLRLLWVRRIAAGNGLGAHPALRVAVSADPAARCDLERLARMLAAVAPDIGQELALLTGLERTVPAPHGLAAVLTALIANGRDLASRVVPMPSPQQRHGWRIEVELGIEPAGDAAVAAGLALVGAACGEDPDLRELDARIRAACGSRTDRFARSQRNLAARALEDRGLAWRGSPEHPIGVVGEGCRRRRLRGTLSDRTPMPGADLAERKDDANRRLARAGLPVAPMRRVASAVEARAAAASLGYPVVVKPIDCSNGRGVSAGLVNPAAVTAAFDRASALSTEIMVEKHLPGRAYRLLVVAGRLVGALCNLPGFVTGDGASTIAELAAAASRAPPRGVPRALLPSITLNPDILAHLAAHGRGAATVAARGERVELHWHGHLSRGSMPVALDAPIHPDNARACCQAAQVVGLDVAGIDFIVPDIARSWRDVGGGICEINRTPGFRTHAITEGRLPVGLFAYLDHLLGADARVRVPIVVLPGAADIDDAANAAADRFAAAGLAVGLATTTRFEAAGLPLRDPGPGHPARIARLVDDPSVAAIVAVVDPVVVLARGFGHGRADLVVIAPGGPAAAAAAAVARALGATIVEPAALGPALDRLVDGTR